MIDGSYMREMYPNICSAAFILECREGSGRIVGSFSEGSTHANAYRGELMGLMAIHLILKAADQLWPGLCGRVVVFSDCLGALNKVANLPPHKIPARCRHSDILKNIMVHCTSLSFALAYSHMKAHQDDNEEFKNCLALHRWMCIVTAWPSTRFGSFQRSVLVKRVSHWNR